MRALLTFQLLWFQLLRQNGQGQLHQALRESQAEVLRLQTAAGLLSEGPGQVVGQHHCRNEQEGE